MESDDTPEQFAYGDNQVDGCPCPVLATGREMTGMRTDIAERFDKVAQEQFEAREGTVSRETASEIFSETIDRLRQDRDEYRPLSEDWEVHNSIVSEAEEIRIALFE